MTGRRLRVAHVITRLELGGAQRNTLHTVSQLDADRFRTSLVCGPGGILDEEARDSGVPITFVDELARPLRPTADLRALARLVSLFRRQVPDIVHTHSSKAGVLGRLAAHLAGVPVVVHSIHGFGFHPGQSASRRLLFRSAERLVAPLTTHFIAVAENNRREGIALGLFEPARVSLIRSGVDLARFRRAHPDRQALTRAGVPEGAPVVGMIACLKPQKAPLDFVSVAARVAAELPAAHFVLVGDGVLRPQVEAAVREAGLAGRLHLLGWRHDVDRLLKTFDLVLHTSRWEGLPRVFLEAMAAQRAVVATDVDGAPDVVRDGVNGFLRPPGDVRGLAASVTLLLRDAALRSRMGRAGLEEAGEFEIDRMVEQQERLYAALWSRVGDRSAPLQEKSLARSRA